MHAISDKYFESKEVKERDWSFTHEFVTSGDDSEIESFYGGVQIYLPLRPERREIFGIRVKKNGNLEGSFMLTYFVNYGTTYRHSEPEYDKEYYLNIIKKGKNYDINTCNDESAIQRQENEHDVNIINVSKEHVIEVLENCLAVLYINARNKELAFNIFKEMREVLLHHEEKLNEIESTKIWRLTRRYDRFL